MGSPFVGFSQLMDTTALSNYKNGTELIHPPMIDLTTQPIELKFHFDPKLDLPPNSQSIAGSISELDYIAVHPQVAERLTLDNTDSSEEDSAYSQSSKCSSPSNNPVDLDESSNPSVKYKTYPRTHKSIFVNEICTHQDMNNKKVYWNPPEGYKRKTPRLFYAQGTTILNPTLLFLGRRRQDLSTIENATILPNACPANRIVTGHKKEVPFLTLSLCGLNALRNTCKERVPKRSQGGKLHSGYYLIRFDLSLQEKPNDTYYIYTKQFTLGSTPNHTVEPTH